MASEEFRQKYDFSILVNEGERMVLEELGQRLESGEYTGICSCQDCVLDMAAYALNKLTPLYRVSLLGTMYTHSMDEGDYGLKVASSVREAIKKISANPSHD
jgi:competence protein ComFB